MSRFAVLYDFSSDTIFGQQAHDLWPRELGNARVAAPGGSGGRRSRSVCNNSIYFFVLESLINIARPNRPREEVKIHKAQTIA